MADIVLKDRNGRDVQYPGVNYLKVNTVDGGTQGFAVYDPETLKSENLPVGVNIGDVKGALEVPLILENVPLALDFSDGSDMEFVAPDGYAVKSGIIQKPANLKPENIPKDMEIAGVVGTLESGGGGSDTRIDYTLNDSGDVVGATFFGFTKIPKGICQYYDKLQWVDFSGCPNLTTIGEQAFYQCLVLTSITIPDSVTSIGKKAFYNCKALTSVTIGRGVTSIDGQVFGGCNALTSVTIGRGVTSIGEQAFYNCNALTSITIPDSVTSINKNAFLNCTALTSVTFEDTSSWYYTSTVGATSGGTYISVTNASTAATYLVTTYKSYYWYKV